MSHYCASRYTIYQLGTERVGYAIYATQRLSLSSCYTQVPSHLNSQGRLHTQHC